MIHRYRFCALLLLTSMVMMFSARAQPQLAELRARLDTLGKTPHDDTIRVDTWMTMAMLYSRISMDTCRSYVSNAMRLSKRIGYRKGYARSVNGMANIDFAQGKIEKAFDGYTEALELFTEVGSPSGQAACHTNLGLLAATMAKDPDAIAHYLRAIEIYRQQDSMSVPIGETYMNLGDLYLRDSATLDLAESSLLKAVAIADKADNAPMRISTYLSLGECYRLENRTTEALGLGLKALQIGRETQDMHGIAQAYTYLTTVYRAKKDYPKVLQFLNEAEATFEKVEDKTLLINIYQKKGDVLVEMGNAPEALEAYKKQLAIAKRMDVPETLRATYRNLAKAYTALGDTAKAAQYEAKALETE